MSKDSVYAKTKLRFNRNNGFKVCRLNHVREYACPDYLIGFCPKGPKCQLKHLKQQNGLIPVFQTNLPTIANFSIYEDDSVKTQ